jgi:hypothetical protein
MRYELGRFALLSGTIIDTYHNLRFLYIAAVEHLCVAPDIMLNRPITIFSATSFRSSFRWNLLEVVMFPPCTYVEH